MSTRSGAGRHGTDGPSSRCWATRADRIRAPTVAEATVVGASDPATGQAIGAFVILRSDAGDVGPDVVQELRNHRTEEIGPIAKPRDLFVVPSWGVVRCPIHSVDVRLRLRPTRSVPVRRRSIFEALHAHGLEVTER